MDQQQVNQRRKNYNTDKVIRQSPFYPQAVIADKFIFLSGTAGFDPVTGILVSDDFETQARQAFANIKTVLEEAGSGLQQIIKTTIFMVTGNDFTIINKVYGEVFPDDPPARSTPQVMPFPGGILISVECIAVF